ncbi:MAG: hypothetical protein ABI823_08100, partial [Bryobacteraceae bacterium]
MPPAGCFDVTPAAARISPARSITAQTHTISVDLARVLADSAPPQDALADAAEDDLVSTTEEIIPSGTEPGIATRSTPMPEGSKAQEPVRMNSEPAALPIIEAVKINRLLSGAEPRVHKDSDRIRVPQDERSAEGSTETDDPDRIAAPLPLHQPEQILVPPPVSAPLPAEGSVRWRPGMESINVTQHAEIEPSADPALLL